MKKFNRLVGTLAACASLLFTFTACNNSFSDNSPPPQQLSQGQNAGALATPLTLEAIVAGAVVTFDNKATGSVKYKLNGGEEQPIASGSSKAITLTAVGDKVEFFGDNQAYATSDSNYSNITCSADCYVYGNIMSLVNSAHFEKATALEEAWTFAYFFSNNTHIKNKDGADLLLPATTLAQGCYERMFYGCKSLTAVPSLSATTLADFCYSYMFYGCASLKAAPSLPAATLAESCYSYMFSGCTSLTAAPSLPATTLAESCYSYMFSGCTSLKAAPSLPATTLAESCYSYMFSGCASLKAAPSLPATTLAYYCYANMFRGCTSLTAAPSLPATTLANRCYYCMFYGCGSLTAAPSLPATTLVRGCYYYMFRGCKSLTAAPSLPATTLVESCYNSMFDGCAKLASVTCLATDISAQGCTSGWLNAVATIGTFIKAKNMTNWPTGASGIPSGWNTMDYEMLATPLTLEATVAGTVVTFVNYSFDGHGIGTVTYKVNGGTEKTIEGFSTTENITLEKVGDKVEFWGDNVTYGNTSSSDSYNSNISCSDDCYVYGNIMSLINSRDFANAIELTQPYTFAGLFYKSFGSYAKIKNKDGADLLLPATKLTNCCYSGMFFGCTRLTKAPELPATTLANYCYESMFCNCTSLTAAPSLNATTLTEGCYSEMFYGCSKLSSITCLATDISANNCVRNWVDGYPKGVAANGTFTKAASMTSWTEGASGIPSDWTVVEQ